MFRQIVRIDVVRPVMKVFHQPGGGVAQVQRYGEVARATDFGLRRADRLVGRIALGTGGQVRRTLGEDDPALRIADGRDRLKGVVGQDQGRRIGIADVLRSQDEHPSGDELEVLAALDHPRQPVHRPVGIAAPDGFDESRDDVVVLLARLVVTRGVLLHFFQHHLVGDLHLVPRLGVYHQFQGIEQFAGIPAREADQGVVFAKDDVLLAQVFVLFDRPVQQGDEVVLGKGFQHVHLAAGKQGRDDFKAGIFRRGADQGYLPPLHGREQRILLRLGKTVDFVDKQDRFGRLEEVGPLGRLGNDVPHVLYPGVDGRDVVKGPVDLFGQNVRQGGLSAAGRPPRKSSTGHTPTR